MQLFKKKIKTKHHDLKLVSSFPASKDLMRAVECNDCGKQFIMDILGGWSIEWKYRKTLSLDAQDLDEAIAAYWKAGSRSWTQLGFTDICGGGK